MIPKQTLTLTQLVPAEPLTSAEARIAPQITREPLIRWGVMSEAVIRLTATLLLTVFAYGAYVHWRADPTRITLLLFMIAECLTVGLSIVTRVPRKRDWRPFAFLCSIGGTYYFLAAQLAPGVRVVPEFAGATLQVMGVFWQLFAKVSLRRSFGILPANRGVVSRGAYRFIRHPMYLGYFVADLGFLLSNFGLQNMAVFGIQFALQAGRIIKEEELLSKDEQYRTYKSQVRYRVIPGLF